MTGFEEKIQKLLDDYANDVLIYNDRLKSYRSKLGVYKEQKLDEECRILLLKISETQLIIDSFTRFHREITESLNNWLS